MMKSTTETTVPDATGTDMNTLPAEFHSENGNCSPGLVNFVRMTVIPARSAEVRAGEARRWSDDIIVVTHDPDAVGPNWTPESVRATSDVSRMEQSYAAVRFGGGDKRVRTWLSTRVPGHVRIVLLHPGARFFVTMFWRGDTLCFHEEEDAVN